MDRDVRHVMHSRHVAGPQWPGAASCCCSCTGCLVLTGLFGSVLLGVSLLGAGLTNASSCTHCTRTTHVSCNHTAMPPCICMCGVRHVLLRGAAAGVALSRSQVMSAKTPGVIDGMLALRGHVKLSFGRPPLGPAGYHAKTKKASSLSWFHEHGGTTHRTLGSN